MIDKKEKEDKMQILYTIKGIQPYDSLKNYVAILLSPVDKIHDYMKEENPKPKINMGVIGPEGPIPPEVQEQMQEFVQNMMGMKKRDHNKDRNIVLIEPEIVFQKRGWRYGDTITATFEKLDE